MDDETREIGCREQHTGTQAWVRYPAPEDLRLLVTTVARRRARHRRP